MARIAVSSGSPPQAVLGAIRRIVQAVRIASRRNPREPGGASAAQVLVLTTLANGNGPMSLNDVARRTRTHQSSASVVVSKLVDRGLVRRTRSSRDARQQQLSLTRDGQKLLQSAPADAVSELFLLSLSRMTRRDVSELAHLLHTFVGKLDEVQRQRTNR